MQLQFTNFLNRHHTPEGSKDTIKRELLEKIVLGSIFWYGLLEMKKDYAQSYEQSKIMTFIREDKEVEKMK